MLETIKGELIIIHLKCPICGNLFFNQIKCKYCRLITNQLKNDIKKSYNRMTSSFDRNIRHMNKFGDERFLPLLAFICAIITVIIIDLILVLISYIP